MWWWVISLFNDSLLFGLSPLKMDKTAVFDKYFYHYQLPYNKIFKRNGSSLHGSYAGERLLMPVRAQR